MSTIQPRKHNKKKYVPMGEDRARFSNISERRRSWVRLDRVSLVLYTGRSNFSTTLPEDARQKQDYDEAFDPENDEVTLAIEGKRGRIPLVLTAMTADELRVMRDYITFAIDKAVPVAQERDRIVTEMYDEYEDDSSARLYRSLPVVYDRTGEVGEYSARLRSRLTRSPLMGRPGDADKD